MKFFSNHLITLIFSRFICFYLELNQSMILLPLKLVNNHNLTNKRKSFEKMILEPSFYYLQLYTCQKHNNNCN